MGSVVVGHARGLSWRGLARTGTGHVGLHRMRLGGRLLLVGVRLPLERALVIGRA
ncbi:hypothetical protein [Arthrobacter sp. H20]|uniref:hypothetical protein n=1 Tax=Arthrobacter sp. H20 TaxID=1267981 RepID=UPI0004B86CEC